MRRPRHIVPVAVVAWYVLAAHVSLLAQGGERGEHWVGSWATAVVERRDPAAGQPSTPTRQASQTSPSLGTFVPIRVLNPDLHFSDQTLRQIVRMSVGGERVRVVLTNAFGTEPLAVGAASVAIRDSDSTIVPASVRELRFSGHPSATIPAGAVMASDPVTLAVPALADLAIDIYLPGDTATSGSPVTAHNRSVQTHYVSATGDHTGVTALPVMSKTESWFFLARVEVDAPSNTGAVVTIGDSITDGYGATVDTNSRWPDHLARRFQAANIDMAVLNVGIDGNRVLSGRVGGSALARFDRDVLVQTGVTHVIVLEGINDIGARGMDPRASAEELIAGHKQLIARAHARGLKIYGATLTPFNGTPIPGYWTADGEITRQTLNAWIRTGGEYDGVIDFDAATLDPTKPLWFRPDYDSGDHLHPGDAGYETMANAVNLEWFKVHRTASVLAR